LADQKGFDLLAEIIDKLFTLEVGFVLLGTGEQKYHDLFNQVARKYPRKAGIRIGYDDRLAHKIEAGADLFLMPSKYEPCGLNQIYSLKYGTIPWSGCRGLDDTIVNYDPATGRGTGQFSVMCIRIPGPDQGGDRFYHHRALEKILRNAIAADFSWQRSAGAYLQLYRKLWRKRA
jgi:starch synthase